jgi:hypothetical protein
MKGESAEERCDYVSESSKVTRSPGQEELFVAGSHDGARRAATFYALFAQYKLNDVNPYRWLLDVLMRIQEHPVNRLNELLPLASYQYLHDEEGV